MGVSPGGTDVSGKRAGAGKTQILTCPHGAHHGGSDIRRGVPSAGEQVARGSCFSLWGHGGAGKAVQVHTSVLQEGHGGASGNLSGGWWARRETLISCPEKEGSMHVSGLGSSRGCFGHLRREWLGWEVHLLGPRSEPNPLLMFPHLPSFQKGLQGERRPPFGLWGLCSWCLSPS